MNRRFLARLVFVLCILLLLCGCQSKTGNIQEKLIRFHCIANSDSKEDQELKLKVRDSVLREIGPKLEKSQSKEQSKKIIEENLETIEKAAYEVLADEHKEYAVSVTLDKSVFPAKMYSDIVLPAGEYDALKVIIGEGQGKNWWCVMFPPLCFIDITRGITSDDSENQLKTVLKNEEYDEIAKKDAPSPDNSKKAEDNKETKITNKISKTQDNKSKGFIIKFKAWEFAQSLFQKFQSAFK
ncbi:stage II sporulation protein R [Oxobacter pfennigii]|uniref:Stage II sporulation protein R n=1 Tax=Oxobacter pfennigii TaxID=36849 RepID=A0A0P8YXU3_9CLOT|nr:stage II sporulation protein R [Oxobacter pfennigii]KPU44581.1 stage II sporulation protein R [Oxobacter pfennigii]